MAPKKIPACACGWTFDAISLWRDDPRRTLLFLLYVPDVFCNYRMAVPAASRTQFGVKQGSWQECGSTPSPHSAEGGETQLQEHEVRWKEALTEHFPKALGTLWRY